LTTQALGFILDWWAPSGRGASSIGSFRSDPVHAHVEFDNGVLLKKALIVAVTVYDEVLAEWERMQQ
jgi:hypothetical protein